MANSSVVPDGPSVVGRRSSFASALSLVSPSATHSNASSGSGVGFDSDGALRAAFTRRGLSQEVAQFLLRSWRSSTKAQYGPHITRWLLFCLGREIDPIQPPVSVLLDYLLLQFNSKTGRGYSSMNTIRSAISAIATIDGHPAGQHPLVSRFMKADFLERPSLPRSRTTWDPQLVLDYLCGLGPTVNLSLLQLSRKLAMLMLLLSGHRGQILHLLDTRNLSVTESQVVFGTGDLLKPLVLGSICQA